MRKLFAAVLAVLVVVPVGAAAQEVRSDYVTQDEHRADLAELRTVITEAIGELRTAYAETIGELRTENARNVGELRAANAESNAELTRWAIGLIVAVILGAATISAQWWFGPSKQG